MVKSVFDAKGLDYRWWVGQDNNVWANIEGIGVQNLGKASGVAKNRAYNQGLDINKEIADPNKPAANTSSDNGYYGGGSSSSSGSSSGSYSTYNAEEEARKANMRSMYHSP